MSFYRKILNNEKAKALEVSVIVINSDTDCNKDWHPILAYDLSKIDFKDEIYFRIDTRDNCSLYGATHRNNISYSEEHSMDYSDFIKMLYNRDWYWYMEPNTKYLDIIVKINKDGNHRVTCYTTWYRSQEYYEKIVENPYRFFEDLNAEYEKVFHN